MKLGALYEAHARCALMGSVILIAYANTAVSTWLECMLGIITSRYTVTGSSGPSFAISALICNF